MPLYCTLLIGLLLFGLASGYPVALVLGGSSILVAFIGLLMGHFDPIFFFVLPERLYGIMNNESLIAIPLFVLMGVILEKSNLAKELLQTMGDLAGGGKTSLSLSVFFVGALLAASTGIVGATVVTMGLISLPSLLNKGVSAQRASGIVAASGTLGQIIPPSIVLIILGDVISTANQEAQLSQGLFKTSAVSVGDLFAGALIPGFILVGLYMLFVFISDFLANFRLNNLRLDNLKLDNLKLDNLKLFNLKLFNLKLNNLKLFNLKLFNLKNDTRDTYPAHAIHDIHDIHDIHAAHTTHTTRNPCNPCSKQK